MNAVLRILIMFQYSDASRKIEKPACVSFVRGRPLFQYSDASRKIEKSVTAPRRTSSSAVSVL